MMPYIEEAERLFRLAERDYQTFSILFAHQEADLAPTCFHAQQSVEKALKSVLTSRQLTFRRTHDLEELSLLLEDAGISPPVPIGDYRRLNPCAVEMRYDDQVMVLVTREEANSIAQETLKWAGKLLSKV